MNTEVSETKELKEKRSIVIKPTKMDAKKRKSSVSIERVKQFAINRGGECLSDEYIAANKKLKFICENKHEPWNATWNSIQQGKWCPHCKKGKRTKKMNEIHQFAKEKGWNCLENTYIDSQTMMKWKCEQGHEIIKTWNSVQQGGECPDCKKEARAIHNATIGQKIATLRNGKLISTKIYGSKEDAVWECAKHHQWDATLSNIKAGTWCPHCPKSENAKTKEGFLKKVTQVMSNE